MMKTTNDWELAKHSQSNVMYDLHDHRSHQPGQDGIVEDYLRENKKAIRDEN